MTPLHINPTLHENLLFLLNVLNIQHKCFFVGGMVRDHLLGRESNDIDIVVERITENELSDLLQHLEMTGKDFPVFRFRLQDEFQVEHEIELSVARIERSTGAGYNDFEVEFGTNVSLVDDLRRRDLTINAMAVPVDDLTVLVDPFNGQNDLNARVLRHTSDAFSEDPLRVFRVARFITRFQDFVVANETILLCTDLGRSNSTQHLKGNRVSEEVRKVFKSSKSPSTFFKFLHLTNNLNVWFTELHDMVGVPQPKLHHGDNDVFDHTMEVLDNAASFTNDPEVLWGALFHDIGKTLTPSDVLPAHHLHEHNGLKLVNDLCKRLRLANGEKRTINDSIKNHMKVHLVLEMKPRKTLDMVNTLLRNNTFNNVLAVSHADRLRKGGLNCDKIKHLHHARFVLEEKLPESVLNALEGKDGLQRQQVVLSHRVRRFKESVK